MHLSMMPDTAEYAAEDALKQLSLSDRRGDDSSISFVDYQDESQLDAVMALVGRDLSEPYSSKFF